MNYTTQFENIINHLEKELQSIHAGRVSPASLDSVVVKAYGTDTPLSQVASITNQGAQMLIVQPWDTSVIKDIERALHASDIGCSPVVDGTVIRVVFPPLTEENRKNIVKIVKQKTEETHIAVKKVREEIMHELKEQKNNKELSEDQFFSEQKNLQTTVDNYNKKIKDLAAAKEREVMTI